MIPTWLQAVVLGVVQGATEFIPVSSSGHLVLLPYLLGWERPGLAFDVALHGGTAVAIFVYFRRDLLGMLKAVLRRGQDPESRLYRRLAIFLVLASVPIALAGLTLEDFFIEVFEAPRIAASFLFVTAAVLLLGERVRSHRVRSADAAGAPTQPARHGGRAGEREADADVLEIEAEAEAEPIAVDTGLDPADPTGKDLERLGLREALIVGVAQCLALFPGMSRSGTTITAGLVSGLTREAATRFSFLLALPALLGALLLSVPDLSQPGPYGGGDILAGVLASFVAGYAAIAFLVQLVARAGLHAFAGYLVIAGLVGWGGSLLIG